MKEFEELGKAIKELNKAIFDTWFFKQMDRLLIWLSKKLDKQQKQ